MRLRCPIFAVVIFIISTVAAHASGPVELASGSTPNHPQQPQVAVDGSGGIHVVYGVGDQIQYCRSTDGGRHFNKPMLVATVSNMSLGLRRGPRIGVGNGFVCITAIGGKQGKGRDGDILAFRSLNGGQSWEGPAMVNDQPDAAREGLHSMAAGPRGELYCVWLDLRTKGSTIYLAKSQDCGATWNKNQLVYESPDGHVCECCHPTVTVDSAGGLHIMWRNWLAGARDMYLTSSADGGETFAKALKLGQGTWDLNRCPMDGGAWANLSPDKHASVWRRGDSIYLAESGVAEEHLLGNGEQPWITAANKTYYIVWLKKRGETLYLLRSDLDSSKSEPTPVELAPHAADPVIAAGPGGSGPVIAVWEGREGSQRSIQCQVVAE